MALKQLVENECGIVVEYWKVSGLNLSFIGKRGFITIVGYLNEASRLTQKDQITLKQITVKVDLFEKYFSNDKLTENNPKDLAYMYIKDNDEFFKESIDVI